MGQTLTHGVYLPDEGERNCYSGLAANWQLLDGAVGTIAEHTAALAGKAPLVHTHTKSDITDFPAYGNAAGTICEGNDSRLSDARTPLAHTHTKSDITDLFNSANTWSGLNSYSNGQIRIKSLSQEIGVIPSSGVIQYLEFADKNDAQHGIVGLWDYSNGASEIQMYITDKFKNGAKDPTGTSESTFLSFGFQADGSKFLTFSGQVANSLIPKANNTYDLGSSTFKWKTLNGINPGVLSLLDYDNVLDVTSEVPVASLDGNTDINLNDYVPNKTGWLSIVIANTTGNFIKAVQGRAGTAAGFNSSRSYHSGAEDNEFISLFMPIIAGTWKSVYIKASSLIQMRFYYCLGNV